VKHSLCLLSHVLPDMVDFNFFIDEDFPIGPHRAYCTKFSYPISGFTFVHVLTWSARLGRAYTENLANLLLQCRQSVKIPDILKSKILKGMYMSAELKR
jgi:hypothetical protein